MKINRTLGTKNRIRAEIVSFDDAGRLTNRNMVSGNEHAGKLTDLQISLLRLLDQGLDSQQTLEIRRLLMSYFSNQLKDEVSRAVEEKGYTDDDFRRMLVEDNFSITRK